MIGFILNYCKSTINLLNQNYSKEEKISLLKFVWKIAYADGELDVNEEKLIRRLADLIKIKDIEVLKLKDLIKNS